MQWRQNSNVLHRYNVECVSEEQFWLNLMSQTTLWLQDTVKMSQLTLILLA